jgi:hypothetical protein
MTTTTGKLHIEFQVREILPDGMDQADARHITFGDDVQLGSIKDFFERCGIATDILFQGKRGSKVIRFATRPNHMIQAIKVLRGLTGLGLLEAKNLAELPPGAALVVFEDGHDAVHALAAFHNAAVSEVYAEGANFGELVEQGTPPYKRALAL